MIQETVIKVYSAILDGKEVKDFERYFYMASFREYMDMLNLENSESEYDPEEDEREDEEDDEVINPSDVLRTIEKEIMEAYGADQASLYLDYIRHKIENKHCNYKMYSRKKGLSIHNVMNIVGIINKFIRGRRWLG